MLARGHARFADSSPADAAERVGAAAGEDSKGSKGSFSRPSSSDLDVSSISGASSADTVHASVASDERERDHDEESFEEGLVLRVMGELHHFGDSSEWVKHVRTHTPQTQTQAKTHTQAHTHNLFIFVFVYFTLSRLW